MFRKVSETGGKQTAETQLRALGGRMVAGNTHAVTTPQTRVRCYRCGEALGVANSLHSGV